MNATSAVEGAAPRVAYFVGRYPAVSHTFITREIAALRERGVAVDAISLWPTPEAELLSDVDREEAARTAVIMPLARPSVVAAQLGALRRSPGAYARMVRRALGLRRPGTRGLMLAATWVLEAAALWSLCRRRGVTHVHAHLGGTAPAVAMLAAELGNAAGGHPRRPWTWSFTIHGPAEFFDVEGEALAEKVRAATFVVCISDFARSQLMGFVPEDQWEKLAVVHCGVDPAAFAPVDRTGREGPFELLTVARMTQIKGQAVALDAVAALAREGVDVVLTLVGDGPRRAELEGHADLLGVRQRVRFEGARGQHEIPGYYERADAFLLTSFAEGVPVVLMEAMATGLPVVAPRVAGVGELVQDGVSGFVVRPGRADLFAQAIETLVRSPDLRDAFGAAGRDAVMAEFDVRDAAGRLESLFARHAA